MSKASIDILSQIHKKLAEEMLQLLESGEAQAKDWAVIVKYLKDNGIDAAVGQGAPDGSAFEDLVKRAQESISRYQ